MKKIMNPTRTVINKLGFPKWAFALVCLVLMLTGISATAAPPANDNFADATVIPASPPSSVNGNNTDATFESGEPTHSDWSNVAERGTNSAWWTWTPSASGSTTIDTMNSAFDTELAVYTGGSVGSLTQVAVNEDAPDLANGWSKVTFNAVSGTTYHIAVAGFENIGGAIVLNFSNGGTVVTGLVLTVNTTGAGTVSADPAQPAEGYASNTVVTLTAVPTGTNTLISWSGTDDDASTNLTNTVTMSGNKTVTANFTGEGGGGGGNCGDLTTITVLTNGNGKVTPNLNGKNNLVVCRTYRLNAIPGKDYVFAGWTGVSSNADNPRLVFEMQPGMTITANFVLNPFVPVSGVFNGLFFEENNVSTACSGSFNLRVGKNGRYTATFLTGGKRLVANGTLDSNGHASNSAGTGTNALTFDIQLDGLAGGDADKVSGTVTTSQGCVAQLSGDREVFNAKNPSPFQGTYTFILPRGEVVSQTNETVVTNFVVVTNNPGTTNETIVTNEVVETNLLVTNIVANPGHSYGTVSISKQGKARIAGELADGSRISQSTAVSKDLTNGTAQVPLSIPLYRGAGSLIGWLNISAEDLTGIVNWEKPAGGTSPNGIDADIEVIGSPFDRSNTPAITLSNGVVVISDLAEPIPVEFSNNTTLVPTGTNTSKVNLKVLPTGLIRGNFVSPVTSKNTLLKGAVLQDVNSGFGFFLAPGTSGAFEVHDATVE